MPKQSSSRAARQPLSLTKATSPPEYIPGRQAQEAPVVLTSLKDMLALGAELGPLAFHLAFSVCPGLLRMDMMVTASPPQHDLARLAPRSSVPVPAKLT